MLSLTGNLMYLYIQTDTVMQLLFFYYLPEADASKASQSSLSYTLVKILYMLYMSF